MSPAANRSRRGALPIAMRLGLGLGFLLAVAATVLVVFTEEVRWLRFAVVLGLWAALIAAFAVTFFRRVARAAEQKTEESKRTYELELHREISARREYEIGVSESAREDAETRHREELAGLREQLDRLNTTLSGLLDGDLLFERLTLSAESTRVRQVGGESGRGRLAAMARPGQIEHLPEPTGPYVGQQSGAPAAAGPMYGGPGGPGGPGPQYPVREDDTLQFPRVTFGPGAPPIAGSPVEPAVVEAPTTAAADTYAGTAAPASPFTRPAPPHVVPEPAPVIEAVEPEPEPVVGAIEPEPVAEAPETVVGPAPEPGVEVPEPVVEPAPEPVDESDPIVEPEPEPVAKAPEPVSEPEQVVEPEPVAEPEEAVEPEPVAEPEQVVAASEPAEPEVAAEVPTFSEPVPTAADAPPEHADAETGHSAGISVADLLAAYGGSEGTPRRRRRAED